MKQLLIPHNVLEIGEESFADCKLLTEVNIPQNIKKVGRCAFDYPTLLKIKLSNKNIDISESRIGYYGDENGLYRKNNNLTIEGYKGSTAQEYAKEHGFNFESID